MINRALQWFLANKLTTLLGALSFCLLVSTITIAVQKDEVNDSLSECQIALAAAVTTTTADLAATTPTPLTTNQDDGTTTEATPPEVVNYRLAEDVIPSHYDLTLYPVLETDTFSGSVIITVVVQNPTDSITLHTNALTYNTVAVRTDTGVQVTGTSYDIITDDREFLIINFQTTLPAGTYDIDLDFNGPLDNGIVGLYASTISTGQKMAASKFQPTYARQAFPCFDEPELKATFDITLVRPSNYTALSNMDEISTEVNGDLTTVRFNRSVPMSTYLACFVICDFEHVENTVNTGGIGDEFLLRSFARGDQLNKIEFAQDIALRATEFYIRYYNVPFPLPKLDMIAIPDYVSGATEHWGLITYRETSFLIDSATSSSANRRNVANTIAHELAHMWFGNLVTMLWWDEVWLNEGFATYMQVKALNDIEPEWTNLDQFLTRTMHSVLQLDATLSSHPIVQLVQTPDEVTAIFDAISYNKGASVLRMMEGFIGAENFQSGVTDYLNQHAFGNTITQDLLNSLVPYFVAENPNLDLTYIVATWTRQMGFPLITVTPGATANSFVLTQSRFLADPDVQPEETSEYNYRWYVPITYKTANGVVNTITWMPDTAESVEINVGEGYSWLKINNDQVGFYRVNYTPAMWQTLIQQLSATDSTLTISDRANLIDEAFQQAFARTISYELPLQLSEYLSTERAFVPWAAASSNFILMRRRLLNSEAYNTFRQFVRILIEPVYATLSWQQDDSSSLINNLLRMEVLDIACAHGHEDALTQARALFTAWLNPTTGIAAPVEADLRDTVYYYGMVRATEEDWDLLWQLYLTEEDAQERAKIMYALAAPQDISLLRKYLNLSWENVRDQDHLTVLGYISANPAGTALVWDFVRSDWERLVERFTLNSRVLGAFIPTITRTFNTQLKLQEMEAFFTLYPDAGAGAATRLQALENVRNNIKWTELNEPTVSVWLNARLAA